MTAQQPQPQPQQRSCTNSSSAHTTATPTSPTITADQVISQSSALNERGLHHLKNGEEQALRSAILCFQGSLNCMSQCFSKQTSPEHWERSFRATSTTSSSTTSTSTTSTSTTSSSTSTSITTTTTKRPHDHASNDGNTPSPLQSTLTEVNCSATLHTQAAEVIFRRAFCTSQVHQIFQHESCHFKRTMNLSAAFVHFNLALSHQLCAMSMMMKMRTAASQNAAAAAVTKGHFNASSQSNHRNTKQQKRLIHAELKLAQKFYQEAYRFMVSSYHPIHCGPPSPHLILNIFFMACLNNMAQVEASLGQTERLRGTLRQLLRFVSSFKNSPTFLAVQSTTTTHAPGRRVRRRMTTSAPYTTSGSNSNHQSPPTNNNSPEAWNAFITQRVTDFFTCVLVLHDYLLASAAAAA